MSLSAGQLETLARLGDAYNRATTQREKDYYHSVANTVRNNAGLRAGVDYNTEDGSSLRAGVVSIPSGRTTANSNDTGNTQTSRSTVVNASSPVESYPARPTTPVGIAPPVQSPIEQAKDNAVTPLQKSTTGASGWEKLVPVGALAMVLMVFVRMVR